MRIVFLLFDGMDLMDFAGPFEAVLTANRLSVRQDRAEPFEVVTVSPDGEPVLAYGGVAVTPHAEAGEIARADVVVVPGTIDLPRALRNSSLLAAIRSLTADAGISASVCTGAFLLGEVGLLADRSWTTHWEDVADLAARLGGTGATPQRVVDTGTVVTAGGIGCGIDLGLYLVARLTDAELARLCARQMDVHWDHFGAADGGTHPVVVERDVTASPATVYELLTTEAGVKAFLGTDAVIEPRIGGRYEYLFLPDEPDGRRGGEGCRILALEPDRMIAFTWNSPPGMATRGTHTWVIVTLTPTAPGTHVRLAHWGHGTGQEWDANREYFQAAWTRVLDRLAAFCRPRA